MDSLIVAAKTEVVSLINDKGIDGVSESEVFKKLYDYNKLHHIFGYGSDSTPEKLIENLILKGVIIRSPQGGLAECRYFMAPVFAS